MAKIIGSPSGQVFVEVCVWILVLSVGLIGYAVSFRKECVRYEKMIQRQSGYPASS